MKSSLACSVKFVLARFASEHVVASGEFRGVRVGMTRGETAAAIAAIGVETIQLEAAPDRIVRSPGELKLVRDADRVLIDETVTVTFARDSVAEVFARPGSMPSSLAGLHAGQPRSDAFATIAEHMEKHRRSVVWPEPAAPWVSVTAPTEAARRERDAFELWRFRLREPEAITAIVVEFSGDRVREIREWRSPVEF